MTVSFCFWKLKGKVHCSSLTAKGLYHYLYIAILFLLFPKWKKIVKIVTDKDIDSNNTGYVKKITNAGG